MMKKEHLTYSWLQGINIILDKCQRVQTLGGKEGATAAAEDRETPSPQPWLGTYSWSCTVFLSRPTLPGWEELAPGSWALAPRAQKAQSRPHRKGVLSSRRDLMVTGTWEVEKKKMKVLSRPDTVHSWETH